MRKLHRVILNFFDKRLVKWIIVPLALLFFWILASTFINPNSKLTFISFHDDSVVKRMDTGLLLKSNKITSEFRSRDNYLGIIWIRFSHQTFVEYEKEDLIIFRIKEKGTDNWYQINKYKSGLIYKNPLFPFGFKIIENSKNKNYIFEIESQKGNMKNAISIDKQESTFFTSYKIPLKEIVKSPKNLLDFMIKKIITSFSTVDFLLYSTFYLLPFIYYFFWRIAIENKIFIPNFWSIFYLMIVGLDILLIKNTYVGIILLAVGVWIVILVLGNYKKNVSFISSFVFICLAIILSFFSIDKYILTKLAEWGYYMLIIGVVWEILLYKKVGFTIHR